MTNCAQSCYEQIKTTSSKIPGARLGLFDRTFIWEIVGAGIILWLRNSYPKRKYWKRKYRRIYLEFHLRRNSSYKQFQVQLKEALFFLLFFKHILFRLETFSDRGLFSLLHQCYI